MGLPWAGLLPALLLAQAGGVVEGTISDSATRAGIGGVSVTLKRAGAPGPPAYRAETDSSGAFRVAGVAPGEYFASFEKSGYLAPADRPERSVLVAPGGDSGRLAVELLPAARLRGRVLESEDRPAPGATVELLPYRGRSRISRRSGPEGEFVFESLWPGRYVLLARAARQSAPPAEQGQRRAWAPTFYPSAAERAQAQPIAAGAGADLPGYDLRLRAVPVYRLRGVVVDEHGRPAARVPVKLAPADWWGPVEAQTVSGEAGAFEFAAVREGEWRLIADARPGESRAKGFAAAVVAGRDLEDVTVRLALPFVAEGFVHREEPPDAAGKRKVSAVYLEPVEGPLQQQASGFHQQDGTLRIKDVYPGRYKIVPAGFMPGYYLESVRIGEQEVMGKEVYLMPGLPPIHVTYKPNAGRVRGMVERGEGATVVLLPKEEALLDGQFIRIARCGPGGSFEAGSLRPGDYYALAFDRVEFDALENPELVRALATRAASVQVRHGEVASVDLRVTPWPEW
jgi:hypothetical protein